MFCFKCSGVLENDKCRKCEEENEREDNNSFNLSPVYLGFLPMEPYGRVIMAMGQLFNDQGRKFKGYWIYFYPDEFAPPNPKTLNLLHIHFFDENGEIRVYLSDTKYLDIEEK